MLHHSTKRNMGVILHTYLKHNMKWVSWLLGAIFICGLQQSSSCNKRERERERVASKNVTTDLHIQGKMNSETEIVIRGLSLFITNLAKLVVILCVWIT